VKISQNREHLVEMVQYQLFVKTMKIIIKFVDMYLIEIKQINEVFHNGNG
jgi:hypothetical protein